MTSSGEEALPALPPIKTAPLAPVPSVSASPSSPARVPAEDTKAEEDQEPSTPTSEESKLRPPTECPPAPRKPPVPRLTGKRKSPLSSRVFIDVPRDLSAVFRSMPPKKQMRVC